MKALDADGNPTGGPTESLTWTSGNSQRLSHQPQNPHRLEQGPRHMYSTGEAQSPCGTTTTEAEALGSTTGCFVGEDVPILVEP